MPITASRLTRFPYSSRLAGPALIVCSAIIYTVYFHNIVFHLNSVMSSLTLDTIKNYYTFAWHIRHDDNPLHFSGMHYPFGEHVVYTDCQPVITFVLRWLPFLHPYSVGIMHGLIFLSFVFTPFVLRKVLLKLQANAFIAWTGSLGLALLSPQFLKMNAGHFGLCYTVLIPLLFLLTIRYFYHDKKTDLFCLFIFNTILFWLHPYMGFGSAVFTAVVFVVRWLTSSERKHRWLVEAVFAGLVPVLLFQLFMTVTDRHPDRPTEPYGLEVMVENFGSLLAPGFGPFKEFLGAVFPDPTDHFEGHSYLGIVNILLLVALPFMVLFLGRKNRLNGLASTTFIASLVFIPVAFGWHHDVLRFLGLNSPAVNQFRAVSRFAWFVYYGAGIFMLVMLSQTLMVRNWKKAVIPAGSVYLLFCLIEAHSFFRLDRGSFWQWRNVFNSEQLTAEEKEVLRELKSPYQALMPLPMFHGGTEMFDRPGRSNSMLPAFIYSYHSGLPVISMMASRTSHAETKQTLSLLNTYKTVRPVFGRITDDPITLIRTQDACLPDEDRVWSRSEQFLNGDSLQFAGLSPEILRQPILDHDIIEIEPGIPVRDTLKNLIVLPSGESGIFRMQPQGEMITFCPLGKNELDPGQYVVSLRYHYEGDTYRAFSSTFVFAEDPSSGGRWIEYIPIRNLSGFYDGFGVFEWYVDIEPGKGYNLVMHSSHGHKFKISDVMIRPASISVVAGDGRTMNNYPR